MFEDKLSRKNEREEKQYTPLNEGNHRLMEYRKAEKTCIYLWATIYSIVLSSESPCPTVFKTSLRPSPTKSNVYRNARSLQHTEIRKVVKNENFFSRKILTFFLF